MNYYPIAMLVVLLFACKPNVASEERAPAPQDNGPFKGMGVRYDGYYQESRAEVLYLIRFFPDGRAVLVNGTKDIEKDLPKFLQRTISSNPANGLYNVKIDVRGDSMFFMTRPEKGEISYKGKVMSTSMVRFNRYSHINGAVQDMEYFFHPDSVPSTLQ